MATAVDLSAATSLLGVTRFATKGEIRDAYKQQCLRHHPDRPNGNAELFKRIHAAYIQLTSGAIETSGGLPSGASTAAPTGASGSSKRAGATARATFATSTTIRRPSSFSSTRGSFRKQQGGVDPSPPASPTATSASSGSSTPMSPKPRARATAMTEKDAVDTKVPSPSSTVFNSSLLHPLSKVIEPFTMNVVMPGTGGRITQPYTFETSPAAFASAKCAGLRHGDIVRVSGELGVVVGLGSTGIHWVPEGAAAATFLARPASIRLDPRAATMATSKACDSVFAELVGRPCSFAPLAKPAAAAHADPFSAGSPFNQSVSSCGGTTAASSTGGTRANTPTDPIVFPSAPPKLEHPSPLAPPFASVHALMSEEVSKRRAFLSAVDEWLAQAWWIASLPLYAPIDRKYNAMHL